MKLETGMTIYQEDSAAFRGMRRMMITRTTRTQAVVEKRKGEPSSYEVRFDREVPDPSYFHERGSMGWGRAVYKVETPELKAQFQLLILRNHFRNIDVLKLSAEQLEAVLAICKKEGEA